MNSQVYWSGRIFFVSAAILVYSAATSNTIWKLMSLHQIDFNLMTGDQGYCWICFLWVVAVVNRIKYLSVFNAKYQSFCTCMVAPNFQNFHWLDISILYNILHWRRFSIEWSLLSDDALGFLILIFRTQWFCGWAGVNHSVKLSCSSYKTSICSKQVLDMKLIYLNLMLHCSLYFT